MATNVYNPRLGSTSSENDVDVGDVFVKPGVVGAGSATNGKQGVKNRCFSEPVHVPGKENKNDAKSNSRTSALSDSSNVLSRKTNPNGETGSASKHRETTECSPVSEIEEAGSNESGDCVVLEPETIRQRSSRDAWIFSRNASAFSEPEDRNFQAEGDLGNDTIFTQSVVFDTTRNVTILQQPDMTTFHTGHDGDPIVVDGNDEVNEEDNDAYPEIEHFPHGYGFCPYGYDEYEYNLGQQMENESCTLRVIPSHGNKFPQLPEDLFKGSVYPKMDSALDLDVAEAPEISFDYNDYELRLRIMLEDNE